MKSDSPLDYNDRGVQFCPKCGAPSNLSAVRCISCNFVIKEDFKWMPITSMVIGILILLTALVNEEPWETDAIKGFGLLIIISIALGIEQIRAKRRFGKKMAYAGIVLGLLSSMLIGFQVIIQR